MYRVTVKNKQNETTYEKQSHLNDIEYVLNKVVRKTNIMQNGGKIILEYSPTLSDFRTIGSIEDAEKF